jgi:hypothetical protein
MSCKKFRAEIEEAGRGAALGADAAAHVAACDSCRAFGGERERLGTLVASLARVEAPADFEFRLRARMARADGEARAGVWRRAFVPGAAWLTAAGCLVLALGVLVHFRTGAPRGRDGDPRGEAAARAAGEGNSQVNQAANQAGGRLANQVVAQGVTSVSGERSAAVRASEKSDRTPGVRGPKVVETGGATLAARQSNAAAERAARRERFVLPRDAVEQIAGVQPVQPRLESRSMDVKPAPIYIGTPIALPVTSPDRKLEALFNDARGAKRVVAVDPVAFGARGPAAKDANVKNVSYTGVW